jgi:hypothetical protein
MRGASTEQIHIPAVRQPMPGVGSATPERVRRVGRLEAPPMTFVTHATPDVSQRRAHDPLAAIAAAPTVQREYGLGLGSAGVMADPLATPFTAPRAAPAPALDPEVWLIALATSGGAWHALEGAGRSGAIRVSRPYGHLRMIHPVSTDPLYPQPPSAMASASSTSSAAAKPRRARRSKAADASLGFAVALAPENLPAERPMPALISAVEVETDAGLFRVERRGGMLSHSDLAWAMANLEPGEPDSVVALPRRQLALLLTLLPTPEDPEHPEQDPVWGWAHRLRGPWERGPLHARGKLGRLIAFDADDSGRGMHRACFELLNSEDVVWAVGVPCFNTGSVYELVPLGRGIGPSRWLSWPLSKGRRRAGTAERPAWEIARVVYRVGAPRWPLAGIVEPLGPMGVAG